MSVLLRQPHGFEGFRWLLVDDQPNGLVIAVRPHMGYAVLSFNPTTSATAAYTDEHDDLSRRCIEELLRLEAKFLEGLLQLTQEIEQRVPSMKDALSADDGGGLVKLEIRS